MNLLIVERHELDAADRITVSGPRARHLHAVLRATPGQQIRIGLRGEFDFGNFIGTHSSLRESRNMAHLDAS